MIEMKISISMDENTKLKAVLTRMKHNETALKNKKLKLSNASIAF